MNQTEVFAGGTNFWSPAVPVPIAEPSLAAAIGDLAGNVGFVTNTILLNLTTNAAYAYDMADNVTNISYNAGEETVGLIWNSQYELTAVHTNGTLAESYRYDPLGRRVRTITGTVTNYHLYNGIHAPADLDATGAVLRAYTYGPGIDNLLAMTTFSASETNHSYYLTDHLGSVLAITDEDGEIVERYHYDAWGRVTITDAVGLPLAESSIGNRFGFQGREHSWATGLIHFRARWYDPITGRWHSNDPIGISGGLNQYVAFGNSPVMFVDPYGLRILLKGPADEVDAILKDLASFIHGDLSTNPQGYLIRTPSDSDCAIEKMVDELIASDGVYSITRSWPPDGVVSGVFRPRMHGLTIGRGGDVFYDPEKPGHYRSGALRNSPHTAASLLSHELLGRAYGNLVGDQTGVMGSKAKNRSNDQALQRTNKALIRMNMNKWTAYN